MDDFNYNFNNDEIIRRILREHNRPLKVINNTEFKDVGDRVIVLDYSSVSHLNGEPLDAIDFDKIDEANLMNNYYIVIETGLRKKVLFKKYMQDLIIVNPRTNEQFRVASQHLRIYRRF
jgi:hypothetical protein